MFCYHQTNPSWHEFNKAITRRVTEDAIEDSINASYSRSDECCRASRISIAHELRIVPLRESLLCLIVSFYPQ